MDISKMDASFFYSSISLEELSQCFVCSCSIYGINKKIIKHSGLGWQVLK